MLSLMHTIEKTLKPYTYNQNEMGEHVKMFYEPCDSLYIHP